MDRLKNKTAVITGASPDTLVVNEIMSYRGIGKYPALMTYITKMKNSIITYCLFFTSLFILTVSNSFSTPLSGTYTIGSGGSYLTINSAFDDARILGISGPVIFDVFSGVYNEQIIIEEFPGSSEINTITLKSQSGNSADVLINGIEYVFLIKASNIVISNLTIGSSASNTIVVEGENISFTNNNFNNCSLFFGNGNIYVTRYNFRIIGNGDAGNVSFMGDRHTLIFNNIQIINNSINGSLGINFCGNVVVEKNTVGNGVFGHYFSGDLRKNIISGNSRIFFGETNITNNFISGILITESTRIVNNTIVGGSMDTTTLDCISPLLILNNLIINPSGGTVFRSYNEVFNSDYNNFYNGGNTNLFLVGQTTYNNVIDYYNATGHDQHSISKPVTFVSPVDFHLAGVSLGDEDLHGIPNALVPDDIDDDPRNPIYPYKGADEADIPLPVELFSFTASVHNNNVQLCWKTSSEVNNSGFDIERLDIKHQSSDVWFKIGFVPGNGTTTTPEDYSFTDRQLSPGKYLYRLKQINFNGNYEYFDLSGEVNIGIPDKYELSQNYPNPFNPKTIIKYQLIKEDLVTLKIFDILGKEVYTLVNENQNAGAYIVEWDAAHFSSGIYFYELRAGSFVSKKRMLLLK